MSKDRVTPEEVEQIRGLFADGATYREVAGELGRSVSTIQRVVEREDIELPDIEARRAQTEAARAARQEKWAELREERADRFGEVIDDLVMGIQVKVFDPKATARDLATALGILVDKAQLLTGGATSRGEVVDVDQAKAELAAMIEELPEDDELAAKRAEKEAAGG